MKEQLIAFETAKLAKEKGFEYKTHNFFEFPFKEFDIKFPSAGIDDEYWGNYLFHNWNKGVKPWKPFKECISAPTQSLLIKFV